MLRPIFIISSEGINKNVVKIFGSFITYLLTFFPELDGNLKKADMNMNREDYVASVLVTFFIYFFIFFGLLTFLLFKFRALPLTKSLLLGFVISFVFVFALFILLMMYPGVLARNRGEKIEKNLVFVLKDLLMELEAGISISKSFFNISKRNYGEISKEFGRVNKQINSGVSVADALKNLGDNIKSEYITKTMWQIANALNAGTSFRVALKNIISDLILDQRAKIKGYTNELNLWSLVYMMFAVALPTIGVTVVIVLSTFSGFGITKQTFIVFLILTMIVQFVIIGLVKSRRPVVNF
ncbi:type II secretion system F family protein [Candidatus Woesearchaeota archaeon]|nr:type II secretion system F family protein [Candidatus Woesearchaeota archaeon]